MLDYLGIKPRLLGAPTATNHSKRKLIVLIGLPILAFGLEAYGFYLVAHQNRLQYAGQITEATADRTFTNEQIPLDGKVYRHCNFQNVTFVWNGTAPFGVHESKIVGSKIHTDNEAIADTAYRFKALGFMDASVPLF